MVAVGEPTPPGLEDEGDLSMGVGLSFEEEMVGTWRRAGERIDRQFRFNAHVQAPSLPLLFNTVVAQLSGTLTADDLAFATPIAGTLEISPRRSHRLRYTFAMTADDGERYRFDGWKTLRGVHVLRAWTTLTGVILDEKGEEIGTALLRFLLPSLPSFIASFQLRLGDTGPDDRRWSSQAGRLEVWYDTLTDPRTGTGLWLHHEICAPTDGTEAYGQGWLALFPPDAAPEIARFGPEPLGTSPWFTAGDVVAEPGRRHGSADGATWDLTYSNDQLPLFTFPRAVWEHELFPSAQIVPAPKASFSGRVTLGDHVLELERAPGGAAHIYGQGNAQRWGWLHADLGDGDVLEIVAAVSRRAVLRHLPPLAFVRLRHNASDWPRFGLLAALTSSAHLDLPEWDVTVRSRHQRLRVHVVQPVERTVVVAYADPDGAPASCRNCEVADAHIVLERHRAGAWVIEGEWSLEATAHAEIGTRP
jgi:hypothetical protein